MLIIAALVLLSAILAVAGFVLRHGGEWGALPGGRAERGDGAFRSAGVPVARGGSVPPMLLASSCLALALGVLAAVVALAPLGVLAVEAVMRGADDMPWLAFHFVLRTVFAIAMAVVATLLVRLGARLLRPGVPAVSEGRRAAWSLYAVAALAAVVGVSFMGADLPRMVGGLGVAFVLVAGGSILPLAVKLNHALVEPEPDEP